MIRFCILIAILILSCREKADESLLVIDTQTSEPSEIKISQLFQNNGMIKLETNDSILISYIKKLCRAGDNLFILATKGSENEILKFNINGKFICRIGRTGPGPGEYDNLSHMTIDTLNERVIVTTQNKVLIYKFDGSFKSIFPLETNTIVQDIYWMDEAIWLSAIQVRPANMFRYLLYSYDINGQKKDSIILGQYFSNNLVTLGNPSIISHISTGKFLYFPIIGLEIPLRDTLFQLHEAQLIPSIKLDFTQINESNYQKIEPPINSNDYIRKAISDLNVWEVYMTDNYLFANYYYKYWPYWFVYNFSKKTGNIISGYHDDIYIPKNNYPVLPLPIDLEKGEFYFTMSGVQLEGKIEGVDENSNPIIFLLRLKE